ncbi:MAG: HEPN domain-containing protein [Oligoflexia bacterium]|nr:HEPN domain-containing protein [Oligoflexia bacterium]
MTNSIQWFERALYDLDTARDLLKSGKYLYVAFMCHQALEKALKSVYLNLKNEMPPYIHNLPKLSELIGLKQTLSDEQTDFLQNMNIFYISSRYPDDIDDMKKMCTNITSENQIKKTEEFLKWLEPKSKS